MASTRTSDRSSTAFATSSASSGVRVVTTSTYARQHILLVFADPPSKLAGSLPDPARRSRSLSLPSGRRFGVTVGGRLQASSSPHSDVQHDFAVAVPAERAEVLQRFLNLIWGQAHLGENPTRQRARLGTVASPGQGLTVAGYPFVEVAPFGARQSLQKLVPPWVVHSHLLTCV